MCYNLGYIWDISGVHMHTVSYLDGQGTVKEQFRRPVERDLGRTYWLRRNEITPESERSDNPFIVSRLKRGGHDIDARFIEYDLPTRICRVCGHRKILDEYRFRLNGRYYRHECRECESRAAASRAWNQRNNIHVGHGSRQMHTSYK